MKRIISMQPCALGLVIVLGAAWAWDSWPTEPVNDLSDWQLRRLVEHLRARGLPIRAVSTSQNGPLCDTAYLTLTDQDWLELNHLFRGVKQIGDWRGVLYCERISRPATRAQQARLWGDCCLVVGPFLFYGDRDLRARVRKALTD